MELWVQMESSPGVFSPPDEDSYSVDFVIDTLNQAYPGCTGVYLSDAGHILAFYGKRGAPNAGLTLEQGMEACMIIQEIPREVEECLATIPQPGAKAILDNAVEPIESRAEAGTQPLQTALAEALEARPARLSTVHVTDWKKAQKEDPVLYQVVKNLKAPREQFKEALKPLIEKKSVQDYVKMKDCLVLKDGLLYLKTYESKAKEVLFRFVVAKAHRSKALDGCHREVAHQGQKHSLSLLSECFWWPGMSRELVKRVKMCPHCRKFEAAPPKAKLEPLPCSGPGEILHIDFTSIEESVGLQEAPAIRNILVIQDLFSKYVVAYVVKDQMAATTAHTLRHGYFTLFGAPAYLVSDQGKAFVSQIVKDLCKLYGVQKLRTLPYHA